MRKCTNKAYSEGETIAFTTISDPHRNKEDMLCWSTGYLRRSDRDVKFLQQFGLAHPVSKMTRWMFNAIATYAMLQMHYEPQVLNTIYSVGTSTRKHLRRYLFGDRPIHASPLSPNGFHIPIVFENSSRQRTFSWLPSVDNEQIAGKGPRLYNAEKLQRRLLHKIWNTRNMREEIWSKEPKEEVHQQPTVNCWTGRRD